VSDDGSGWGIGVAYGGYFLACFSVCQDFEKKLLEREDVLDLKKEDKSFVIPLVTDNFIAKQFKKYNEIKLLLTDNFTDQCKEYENLELSPKDTEQCTKYNEIVELFGDIAGDDEDLLIIRKKQLTAYRDRFHEPLDEFIERIRKELQRAGQGNQ